MESSGTSALILKIGFKSDKEAIQPGLKWPVLGE